MQFVAGAQMSSADEGKPPGRRPAGGQVRTKKSAWWLFLILVGCRLSHAAQSPSACVCNDQLESVCAPVGGEASVPCPKSDAEELTFTLLRDKEIIYTGRCNNRTCESRHARAGVELRANVDNTSVGFVLTGVNASSHGSYRCEGTVMFPPPLVPVPSNLRVMVLIEGHQCKKVCRNEMTVREENCGFHWVLIIATISIYSITVTLIAIVFGVKLRRTDSESDYMNTKPKAPREHRKRRGVQIPIPKHF